MSVRKHDLEIHYDNIFDRNVNFKQRIIYLNSDIDDFSLELFQKAFDELEQDPKPIKIEISSYGGILYDMFGILDRMKSSECKIITRGFGKIMSAASFVLAAGSERYVGSNCWIMIHEMSDWVTGSMSEIKDQVKQSERIQVQLYTLYEKLSKGKTKAKEFEKMCTKKDFYLSAPEAIRVGLADKTLG